MKLGLRKKRLLRFVISLALLLCGVFALYPHLASRPQRHLRKSVAGLEKTVAASVLNDIALGQDIAAKARALAKSAQDKARLTDLAEGLEKNVKELKKNSSPCPSAARSSATPPAASTARLTNALPASSKRWQKARTSHAV